MHKHLDQMSLLLIYMLKLHLESLQGATHTLTHMSAVTTDTTSAFVLVVVLYLQISICNWR